MHQKIKCSSLFLMLIISAGAEAAHHCSEWLAKVISIQGKVDRQYAGELVWHTANLEQKFCRGDKIRTGKHSRVTLLFNSESRATLDQNSTLAFFAADKETSSWFLKLLQGSSFFRSRQPQKLNIQTPFINAVHQGTEFLVTVDSKQTEISVFDGEVAASNQIGEILIKKGYTGIAQKDQLPQVQAFTIRPEDAVQWTLYYPPIIDYQSIESSKTVNLKPAINAYHEGNTYQAINLLERIPSIQWNISYLALKSSLLLTAGSVNEAEKQIDQILVIDKENSAAFALLSIIAVAKNKQKKAFDFAQKAITFNPKSAVAQIALSYAYQSQFKIELALKATQDAVRLSPDNALAWARLAELQLSTGERDDAMESAKKAQALNPKLGRTQTVLGFAYLAQIDIDKALVAFSKAINLNSADPLARLGLGLAKIRKGDIEEGTSELETAVSLDPDNSIMRSYLGKAYYELRNDDYAATELTIAKAIDPNDPTPWFYDAIRKQTTNRPVEALHDMQKAIELNDNRGVYRSKLLLDEDAAARSANMSRLYQDLDFDRVALKQAWLSLGQDFTNHSAHRFLSDTLQGRPRLRIARASELLQAQLFQPISIVPVQPQLTSENIGILNSTGPGSLSSNEYDSLFTSNGAHIFLNGAIGSNNTLTDSAIISGVYDQFSLSFGQFHYQTDGFRNNDDYQQNIYNAFAQFAITPDLNIQVEFKREDVTAGDVSTRINGFHDEDLRQSKDQDTARLGLSYKINPEQELIFSGFLTDFKEISIEQSSKFTRTVFPFPFPSIETTETNKETIGFTESGYQLESQYLFHRESFNIIAGVGFLNLDATRSKQLQKDIFNHIIPPTPGFNDSFNRTVTKSDKNFETNYFNGYLYSNIEFIRGITSIFGLSYDSYDDDLTHKNQLNPKLGLIWNPIKNFFFRGAVFRTLKRPLTGSQTIEPTQIAGFNQFYDENDGTTAWQYGIGIDYQPVENVFIGGETTWRDTKQPEILSDSIIKFRKRDESAHLAYLYWTPLNWLAMSSQYQFDEFRKTYSADKPDNENARSIATHQVLLSVNYFHPSGVFSKFSSTFINQTAEFVNDKKGLDKESDHFWLFDTSLGFRLPKKMGTISFEVKNLFNNKNFRYQSEWNSSGPQLSNFVPEREFFFKLNLVY